MSNIYLEKIARRLSTKKTRSLFDEGKEIYGDGKDVVEIKKRLIKDKKLKKTVKVVTPNNKKRMSVTGRRWNRGVVPQRKKK